MKNKVIMRADDDTSPFKKDLLNLLSIKGDKLILGYGYLHQDVIKDEELLDNIVRGFKGITEPEFILIGKCSSTNQSNGKVFREFINNVKSRVPNLKTKLILSKEDNFHCKIAIKYENDLPKACIVGSSNLTNKTFFENTNGFNNEVDVVYWSRKYNSIFNVKKEDYESQIKNINDCIKRDMEKLKLEMESKVDEAYIKTDRMLLKSTFEYLKIEEDEVLVKLYNNINCLKRREKYLSRIYEIYNCYVTQWANYEIYGFLEYFNDTINDSNYFRTVEADYNKRLAENLENYYIDIIDEKKTKKEDVKSLESKKPKFLDLIYIETKENIEKYLKNSFIKDDYLLNELKKEHNGVKIKELLLTEIKKF